MWLEREAIAQERFRKKKEDEERKLEEKLEQEVIDYVQLHTLEINCYYVFLVVIFFLCVMRQKQCRLLLHYIVQIKDLMKKNNAK